MIFSMQLVTLVLGAKSLDTGLPVPNSQGKLMCPRGSRLCSVYGVQRLQGVPLGQGSSRVSESFANFNLRMILVLSTFPEDGGC